MTPDSQSNPKQKETPERSQYLTSNCTTEPQWHRQCGIGTKAANVSQQNRIEDPEINTYSQGKSLQSIKNKNLGKRQSVSQKRKQKQAGDILKSIHHSS